MNIDYEKKVRESILGKVKICETEEDKQKLTDHVIRYANATLPNTLHNAIFDTLITHLIETLLLQDETEKNKCLNKVKLGLSTADFLVSNGLINPHYYISHPVPNSCEVSNGLYKSVMPQAFSTCKNILLKDNSGNVFLVIVPFEKHIDIKELRRNIKERVNDCGKLQFVPEEEMKELLGVESGALSLFSLIYDKNNTVTPVIDDDLPNDTLMAFHPNYNKLSLFIYHSNDKTKDDMDFFLRSLGKKSISLKVPERVLIDDVNVTPSKKL